jgi:hypothetical protein
MTHPRYTLKLNIGSILQVLFITLCGTSVLLFIAFTLIQSEPHDFGVYYYSAKTAINGGMIYDNYGPYNLPYWYFPWVAWFYIPFAFFPQEIAYTIYLIISFVCAFTTIDYLVRKMIPNSNLPERLFIFFMALTLCWLLFRVGQMDFILLATAVLIIVLIDNGKPHLAGLLVPVILFKPHLFIIFLPATLFKGKRSFFVSSTVVCLILLIISFIVIPDWPLQMLRLLTESGQRTDNNWNFITLPNMLGMQENWSGTANLPITFALILAGSVITWKFRVLPTVSFLSLALAGSLFCAPRAYSYNLPILLPAMIWISSNLPKRFLLFFWLAVGIVPFLFRFSSGTYSIVLAIFVMGTIKAHRTLLDAHL